MIQWVTDDPRFQQLQYHGNKCKDEMLKHLVLFAVKKGEIKKSAFQEFVANNVPLWVNSYNIGYSGATLFWAL